MNTTSATVAGARMERVARSFRLGEQPHDYEHWLTLSMTERLDALLRLIDEQHGWTRESAPRLERVLATSQRVQG